MARIQVFIAIVVCAGIIEGKNVALGRDVWTDFENQAKTIRLINDEPAETAQSDVSRSIYPQTEKKLRHDHPKPAHRTHEENEANFREDRHCEHCSLRESRIEKICNALRKFFRFLDRPIATIFWSVVDFLIPENRRRGGREDTRDEDEHGEHETHHEEEQEEIHDAGRQYAQNNPSPIGQFQTMFQNMNPLQILNPQNPAGAQQPGQ